MQPTVGVPTYAELRARTDAPPGSSWGVFGQDDEVGTINFLTPDRVIAAAQAVRRGAVFNMDHTLDAVGGPVPYRTPPRHEIIHLGLKDGRPAIVEPPATILDDYLDGLWLQGSTQIDGLRHHAHPDHGFYGGAASKRMVSGDPTIGVNRWADHGIVGRGVLIDVARYREHMGDPLDHDASEPIDHKLLEATLSHQKTTLAKGDMILVRTDWPSHSRRCGDDDACARNSAGLAQSYELIEWLWNNQVPLVASDNYAVEASLRGGTSEVGGGLASELGEGFLRARLHDQLIPLLGMALGELWQLDELADDCAQQDGVYEFMLVAKPLNITGGVGSPANATAIK
jgi:kynurenine formamidase